MGLPPLDDTLYMEPVIALLVHGLLNRKAIFLDRLTFLIHKLFFVAAFQISEHIHRNNNH